MADLCRESRVSTVLSHRLVSSPHRLLDNEARTLYTRTSGDHVQIILGGSVEETVPALKVRPHHPRLAHFLSFAHVDQPEMTLSSVIS